MDDSKVVRSVACPKCGAEQWQPCTAPNHTGGVSGVRPHKERIDAAAAEVRNFLNAN